jgi:hypothetical protein
MKTLYNIGLTGVLLAVLILPVLGVHTFVAYEYVPEGLVSGARDINQSEINILPNATDFNGYVSFNPSSFANGVYRDQVELTLFQRQKATYRGLYSIYNLTDDKTFSLTAVASEVIPADAVYDHVLVGFGESEYGQVLTRDLAPGDTVLPVLSGIRVSTGDMIVIGDELVEIVTISGAKTVVTPVEREHLAGERIYPQSVVIQSGGEIAYPRSGKYALAPGERVFMHIETQGSASLLQQDQKLTIPLEIRVEEL